MIYKPMTDRLLRIHASAHSLTHDSRLEARECGVNGFRFIAQVSAGLRPCRCLECGLALRNRAFHAGHALFTWAATGFVLKVDGLRPLKAAVAVSGGRRAFKPVAFLARWSSPQDRFVESRWSISA